MEGEEQDLRILACETAIVPRRRQWILIAAVPSRHRVHRADILQRSTILPGVGGFLVAAGQDGRHGVGALLLIKGEDTHAGVAGEVDAEPELVVSAGDGEGVVGAGGLVAPVAGQARAVGYVWHDGCTDIVLVAAEGLDGGLGVALVEGHLWGVLGFPSAGRGWERSGTCGRRGSSSGRGWD